MTFEDHMGIIGRFILALLVYIFGALFMIFIIYVMGKMNYFIFEDPNRMIFGIKLAVESRNTISSFIYGLMKFLITVINVLIIWFAGKMLKLFRITPAIGKMSRQLRKYGFIYGFLGGGFAVLASAITWTFYATIGFFAGLQYIDAMGYDDVIYYAMGAIFCLITMIMFVVAGVRNGLDCASSK